MAPEYGATCAIFPIDAETLRYLRFTGRSDEQVALVEAYARSRASGTTPTRRSRPSPRRCRSTSATVEPSLAGPKRPQDRVALSDAQRRSATRCSGYLPEQDGEDDALEDTFPASDPTASQEPGNGDAPRHGHDHVHTEHVAATAIATNGSAVPVTLADGTETTLDHGHVVIAAITSCTNTSNPSVMLAAGLLARNAVETRPQNEAVGQDVARAGLEGRDRVLRARRASRADLDALGFHLVGYGCTTCIGNSGPLPDGDLEGDQRRRPRRRRGALGQPQLRGAHQPRRAGELPRVAAARRRVRARRHDGRRPAERAARRRTRTASRSSCATSGRPRPRSRRRSRRRSSRTCSARATTTSSPATSAGAGSTCPTGDTFAWDDDSTYVQNPPYFVDLPREPAADHGHRGRARARAARRLGHDRPHLARGRDQAGQPGRPLPAGARRRAARTSTPTARGAATTR